MANVPVPGLPVVNPVSGDTVVGVKGGQVKRYAVGGVGLAGLGVAQTFTEKQSHLDTAGASDSQIAVEHYGDGSGGSGNQTYGIDIHNNPGARQALVLHQYSNVAAALHIDNTDTNSAITIVNTNNPTRNPGGAPSGTSATGNFLNFTNTSGTPMFRVLGRGEILINATADATGHGIEVVGNASSTRRVLRTTMNGANTGVEFIGAAGSAGFFPLLVTGQDFGPRFTTSTNNGRTLELVKSATGTGDVLRVANSGTGLSIDVRSGSSSLYAVTAAGLPQWVAAANQQTTVGAAGGASALPATPSKYLKVVDSAGTTFVVPCYAAT